MVLSFFGKNYNTLLDLAAARLDPRLKHLPFMGSPVPVSLILTSYTIFVLIIGPKMMKGKQPYNLTNTIKMYNLLQIFFNAIGVVVGIVLLPKTSFFCTTHGTDMSTDPDSKTFAYIHYGYMLLKGFDLLDTIFFVLRKKFKQITFLHLYHHIVMLIGSWVTCNYLPGGQLFFLGLVNTFVHVIMYFYYFLTSWDAQYKKSIWWKKHITQLQITQHCFIFISCLVPLLNKKCTYPKVFLGATLPPIALMIYLFTDFYIKTYHTPKTIPSKRK